MKKIKQILFMTLLGMGCNTMVAQNLDSMPVAQRDSLLISRAKEVVLIHGPDFYRDKFPPIIQRTVVPPPPKNGRPISPTDEKLIGSVLYSVTFLYDQTEEKLSKDYAALVSFFGSTGNPESVMFGNGLGIIFSENNDDWRHRRSEEPSVHYQESIFPIFDFNNIIPGQDPTARDPINKDELLHRGWQRNSDGVWERTRPDAPPASAQRAIKQAKEDVRRREAEREKNRGGDENRD